MQNSQNESGVGKRGQSLIDSSPYPVLPLRDIIVYPHMVVPLFVGREKSVRALDVIGDGKQIVMLTQKSPNIEDPTADDLFTVGTLATVLQLLKLPDGTVKVLVEGAKRVHITRFTKNLAFLEVMIAPFEETLGDEGEIAALSRTILNQFSHFIKINKKIPSEIVNNLSQISDPSRLADAVASHIGLKIPDRQNLLETANVTTRLERLFALMEGEIGVLQVEKKIRSRVKRQMERAQREYFLNEQLKAIQKELGEGEDGNDELAEIESKIKKLKLSKEGQEKVVGELRKLRSMSPMSAEATVVRNYLDWIISLPWKAPTKVKLDLGAAEQKLNDDHYGLEKVKERILEYLAVQIRTRSVRGSILCLVGPPGVGKTSLGKSIAEATGRNFVRISLGGVRDEAEIRGHRRTYIGSMPGKILQGMKKAKSSNPLFLLDEIDKIAADWRGDPASALLEVLDPEQNSSFNDHYLELDYDLSDVMFVTTANSLNMPQPLLDRMEIIRLPGYTEDEKVEIAKRHLIPKQVKLHGLEPEEWQIEESALRELIRYYTREAGVRNLEREISNLTRKAVKKILSTNSGKKSKAGKLAKGLAAEAAATEARQVVVTLENIGEFAGIKKYRFGELENDDMVGVVTGLAWTEVGGELLTIESVTIPGKGRVFSTGKLGEVMKESVQAAESYVKSRAYLFGLRQDQLDKRDIHVHVPEGATPKDGPSAGIAMVTSIVSVLTGIPVRRDVAMTGEITLRGRVLPIGGLKEKLLAALRGGISTVLIPADNEKDLADIPKSVTSGMTIIPVSNVDKVLEVALVRKPEAFDGNEPASEAPDSLVKAGAAVPSPEAEEPEQNKPRLTH